MFQGLRTVLYRVADLPAAKRWYADILEKPPYFDQPFYVGFEVGGYELGLVPVEADAPRGLGGTVAYWGVSDVAVATERLVSRGATIHQAARDVGEGIIVATFLDPFGNELGVIVNPNFKVR